LFICDAEKDTLEDRRSEIYAAKSGIQHHVAVVPVRMLEAWLLHDDMAIRSAAGNPNSNVRFELPPLQGLENQRDPRAVLFDKLLVAGDPIGSRRRRKFQNKLGAMRHLVARHINDYSDLEVLPAFQHWLRDLDNVLEQLKSNTESD